jgi:hypothetical protein
MNKRKRNQRAMRRQHRRYQQEMSRQRQNRTYDLAYPKDAKPSDSFEAVEMVDDFLSGIGVQPKDVAIVFHTDDFKSGDLVLFKNSLEQFIGKYYPAPGGLMRLEPLNDEYETDIYRPGEGAVMGRVIRFERAGEVVHELRPVRRLGLMDTLRSWVRGVSTWRIGQSKAVNHSEDVDLV